MNDELLAIRWTISVHEPRKRPKDKKTGMVDSTCRVDLLFDGAVVHTLTGPTAEKALKDVANKWNADSYVPNLSAGPKVVADGIRLKKPQ